jgi:CBS domain-containing protein
MTRNKGASMDATCSSLTAGDVMNRDLLVVPRQMLVREAARLIDRARAGAAVVVDEQGRCVGMLSPADIFRWIGAGCPEAVIGPILRCPYQVRGRALTGGEAVICIRAHGSCSYQVQQPTIGGRHTELCMRQESEQPPFGGVPCYVTTGVVAVGPETPLPELVQQFIDARADRIIVRDEVGRPIGGISATDVLKAVAAAPRESTNGGDS